MFSLYPTKPENAAQCVAVGFQQDRQSAKGRLFLLSYLQPDWVMILGGLMLHTHQQLPSNTARRQELAWDKLCSKARITICCGWLVLLLHSTAQKAKA